MELVLAALEQLVAAGSGNEGAATSSHAPTQIIVHQGPDCAAATVTTSAGERPLAPAQLAALACDAQVAEPGKPNRATITPRSRGGSNKPANLVTPCGRCHAFVQEQAVAPAQARCAGTLSAEGAA